MAKAKRSNRRNPRRHNPRRSHARELLAINPRRHNPRRRRNPQVKGLVAKSAIAALGAAGTNALLTFVPKQWQDGWAGIGVRLGVAYGLGYAAERFVSKDTAEMLAVGGAAAAVGEAINMLMGRVGGPQIFVQPAPHPASLPAAAAAQGLTPVGPPQPLPAAGQSVSDLVEVDGPWTEYGDQGFGDIIQWD